MRKLVVKMMLGAAALTGVQGLQAQDPLTFEADFTLGDMGGWDGRVIGAGLLWPTSTMTDGWTCT